MAPGYHRKTELRRTEKQTPYEWEVKYHTHILRRPPSAVSPALLRAAETRWEAVGRRIREVVTRGDGANRA